MIFTIAIDGPAAAGKGTVAKAVAAHFGLPHLDTGLLYRATGRRVLDGMAPVAAARALEPGDLDRDDLRSDAVAQAASEAAADPDVRQALVEFQRSFARREGGAVLDGRDIGTAICPEAEVKLYVTANDAVRARRRFAELTANGHETTEAEVLAGLQARDARDTGRASAPLRPAADAVVIDTSQMSVEAAVAAALQAVAARRGPEV